MLTDGLRLAPHVSRAVILGEVHARPFTALATPSRVLHFAFETTGERSSSDRAALIAFCKAQGLVPPQPDEKHFRTPVQNMVLRWEQHSEFTTYTWEIPAKSTGRAFHPSPSDLARPMSLVPQPGPLLVAIDLHLLSDQADEISLEGLFDRASIAVAENADRTALYATDYKVDPAGFVRILIIDRGLDLELAGALVQRILELETYRTLALLGLPEAQRLAPSIARIEARLVDITRDMRFAESLVANHHLLNELTALAADLEAGAAASLFRFGASRAYNEIVQLRLQTIGENKVGGLPTWSAFLARRMNPAMRTCLTTEERQASLSEKLARTANLLRTRVDVARQQQNQDLLESMNAGAQLQLRLQATVEGLSVAAISYYVVGLFGYIVKGLHDASLVKVEPTYAMAIFTPIAVVTIWWVVSRIRRKHFAAVK